MYSPEKREIRSTIEAFTNNLNERGTLFTMAIASRNEETLNYVKELIEKVFKDDPREVSELHDTSAKFTSLLWKQRAF